MKIYFAIHFMGYEGVRDVLVLISTYVTRRLASDAKPFVSEN